MRVKDGYVQVAPVLCDTWACKLCGPKRAAWLKREVHKALFRHGLKYFWTLTIDAKRCSAAQSHQVVTAAWHIVRTNLKRDRGPFSYVWVMEATQRGYAHLHLLCSLEIGKRDLRQRWFHATDGSFQVDVQSVASDRAANYLAKYCAKQAQARCEQGNDALWHKHVYGKSRDVRLPCFRCHQVHEPGQESCETDGEPWYHWRVPYKDAVELLGREMALEVNKTANTPHAALRASEGLDIVALCERIGGELAVQPAGWRDSEPVVDDQVAELPDELADMDAFLAAMGVHDAPA